MAAKKKTPGGGGLVTYATIAARIVLGGLLFYAGFNKLMDVQKFSKDISHFRLLPDTLDRVLAIVLPWNEIVVGVMLIVGIWVRTAALASLFFFTVFAIAVTSAIARNLNIECGCLGNADASKVGIATLGKDAIGLALAGFIYLKAVAQKPRKA